jgi:hypothetical protein
VFFVNLVLPVGLISSWQRFRAFDLAAIDIRPALLSGLKRIVSLWVGLIAVALCFAVFGVGVGDKLSTLFDALQLRGEWWRFFIFPILTVAALSAMYSCSDTCVSALLYLIEYSASEKLEKQSEGRLPIRYYWAMALIFVATLASYWLLRSHYQDISRSPLFTIATAVYASVCVIAPILLLTAVLPPVTSHPEKARRSHYVGMCLIVGSVTFWGCTILGFWKPVFADCAVVPALLVSGTGSWLLYRKEQRVRRSEDHGGRNYRVLGVGTSGQNRAV